MADKLIIANASPVRSMLLQAHLSLGDGNGLMITRRVIYDACELIGEIHGRDFAIEMVYAVGDALVAKRAVDFDTIPNNIMGKFEREVEALTPPVVAPPAPQAPSRAGWLSRAWASAGAPVIYFALGMFAGSMAAGS